MIYILLAEGPGVARGIRKMIYEKKRFKKNQF